MTADDDRPRPICTLADGFDRVWNELESAVRARRHGFHTFTLATVENGLPSARVVVLREADRCERRIRFHTDARSPKVEALRATPYACAVFYGPAEKLQVRAYGGVSLHHRDALSHRAWEASLAMSRECYRVALAPGSPLEAEQPLLSVEEAEANFCVCYLTIDTLEWLSLAYSGHQRARCVYTGNAWTMQYVQV